MIKFFRLYVLLEEPRCKIVGAKFFLCNVFLVKIEYTNRDTKKRLNGGIRNFVNEPG